MSKTILSAILLSASLAVPAAARDRIPDIRITYSDLNLSTPAGLRALDRRISRAIKAVCADDGTVVPEAKMAVYRCRRAKMTAVAPQREVVLARFKTGATRLAAER